MNEQPIALQYEASKTTPRPVEFKVNLEQNEFEGYAAHFENVDLVGDVIVRGAFAKTIAERLPKGLIKVFDNHMWMIGIPRALEEDSTGLRGVFKVSQTQRGQDVLILLRDGVYQHMSIGYDVVRSMQETRDGMEVDRLTELKLYECSPVAWPANEMTSILAVKNFTRMARELPAFLDLAKYRGRPEKDRELLKTLASHLESAAREMKAACTDCNAPAEPTPQPAAPGKATRGEERALSAEMKRELHRLSKSLEQVELAELGSYLAPLSKATQQETSA